MIEDGFTAAMPEYQEALHYFAASTRPSRIAVGHWDSDKETLLDAVMACRKANWDWYALSLKAILATSTVEYDNEDVLNVAAFIETCVPSTAMACATSDIELIQVLEEKKFNHTLCVYTEVSLYIAAALLGWAMGANTGADNSAFALAYKELVNIKVDDLDDEIVNDIKRANGNYYINRGGQYDCFETGVMSSGAWFDEIINLHMLENRIQAAVMELLKSRPKVPGTESGVLMITTAILPELDTAQRIGFIAPGIWDAPPIRNLATGDAVPNGYFIQSDPVDSLTQADREARQAPPIFIALKLAGALQHVVIQIDVNR